MNEQSLKELWATMKHSNTNVMVTPDEEERKKESERIFVEIMAKYFPSLIKYMSLHIYETQRTLRRISRKIHTEPHCNQIVKTQEQKRIWKTAKEKQLTIQKIFNKVNILFHIRNLGGCKGAKNSLNCQKELLTKVIYLANYSLKMRRN